MTGKAPSRILRALAIGAAFYLLVPDAARALALGFTQAGGLDVVYPDAARAFGIGRLLFFAAVVACVLGLEKQRGFFLEATGKMPALYGFPKQVAGGFSVAGIFACTLGIMLHFFEAWSLTSAVFAILLGAALSFYVLGALASDGAAPDMENLEVGGV